MRNAVTLVWGSLRLAPITISPNSSTEAKTSIVNAYYDSLEIKLSREDLKGKNEDHPAGCLQYIAHCIRMRRELDFESDEVSHNAGIPNASSDFVF